MRRRELCGREGCSYRLASERAHSPRIGICTCLFAPAPSTTSSQQESRQGKRGTTFPSKALFARSRRFIAANVSAGNRFPHSINFGRLVFCNEQETLLLSSSQRMSMMPSRRTISYLVRCGDVPDTANLRAIVGHADDPQDLAAICRSKIPAVSDAAADLKNEHSALSIL